MPDKIKSKKQLKFIYAAASGKLSNAGPSPAVAKEMISHESKSKKRKLMRA